MEHLIKLNKKKQLLGIIISIGFIALGSALVADPYAYGSLPLSKDQTIAAAITLIAIFAAVLIFLAYKMATKQIGVIINAEGILDQTNALKLNLVTWGEIDGFSLKKQLGMPLIAIYLKDPEAFLASYSGIGKTLLEKNAEQCSTPFVISTTMLDIKVDELKRILEAEGAKHGLKFDD